MEQPEQNKRANEFAYFQSHGDEEGRRYTIGFGNPDEIEPPFIIVGSEFLEEDAMIAVDRLNYILSEQTASLREELETIKAYIKKIKEVCELADSKVDYTADAAGIKATIALCNECLTSNREPKP